MKISQLERDIRIAALAILAVCLVAFLISLATFDRGSSLLGKPLGGDFVSFDSAGALLANSRALPLYDAALQDQFCRERTGLSVNTCGSSYYHPPWLAAFFALLSRVPFQWSYCLWTLFSAALAFLSLRLIVRQGGVIPFSRQTVLLLCLAFEPLIVETILGGQLASLGMSCLILAQYLFFSNSKFAAGAVLGICTYKPTLLIWILPMLVLYKEWRTLGGFMIVSIVLNVASIVLVGFQQVVRYYETLAGYAGSISQQTLPYRQWKFIDVTSNVNSLFAGVPFIAQLITVAAFAALCVYLYRSFRGRNVLTPLTWGLALVLTVTWNIHLAVYDSIIIIAAIGILALELPKLSERPQDKKYFLVLCALVYLSPWLTALSQGVLPLEPYAVVLLVFSLFYVRVSRYEARISN